ncbi:hypothetical protein AIIKEEIJ_04739 [Rhodococcus sp. YH1]|nr:hypothetical protein [Rhodococcus sp. YH1]
MYRTSTRRPWSRRPGTNRCTSPAGSSGNTCGTSGRGRTRTCSATRCAVSSRNTSSAPRWGACTVVPGSSGTPGIYGPWTGFGSKSSRQPIYRAGASRRIPGSASTYDRRPPGTPRPTPTPPTAGDRPTCTYSACSRTGDKATADPLDVGQWQFYVTSTRRLDETVGEQKRISLAALLQRVHPVRAGSVNCEGRSRRSRPDRALRRGRTRSEARTRRTATERRRVALEDFSWDTLRPGLLDAIESLLSGRDVLAAPRTGCGKPKDSARANIPTPLPNSNHTARAVRCTSGARGPADHEQRAGHRCSSTTNAALHSSPCEREVRSDVDGAFWNCAK